MNIPNLKKYPRLSAEEQEELLSQFSETKSEAIKSKIFKHNLGLVAKQAHKHQVKQNASKEDLFQEGCLGLMRAIEKFDVNAGVKFSTYAHHWIKAMMLRFIYRNNHAFKMSTSPGMTKIYWNLSKTVQKLKKEGKEPTFEAIAEELGADVSDVTLVSQILGAHSHSLDDTESEKPGWDVSDENRVDIEDQVRLDDLVTRKQLAMKYRQLANHFYNSIDKDDQKFVFKNRFMKDERMTFAELQKHLGATRQNWSVVEQRLQARFKKLLAREGLRP